MKSHIKITSHNKTLGIVETREFTFSTSGVIQVLDTFADFIKEFSADRTKRKTVISISIDKEG